MDEGSVHIKKISWIILYIFLGVGQSFGSNNLVSLNHFFRTWITTGPWSKVCVLCALRREIWGQTWTPLHDSPSIQGTCTTLMWVFYFLFCYLLGLHVCVQVYGCVFFFLHPSVDMSLYVSAILHMFLCVCVCVFFCWVDFFNSQSLAPGLEGSMGDCEGLRGISVDQNRSVGIIWDHWPSLWSTHPVISPFPHNSQIITIPGVIKTATC